MALDINTRENEGITIVEVAGRLTMGDGCTALNQQLEELINGGRQNFLLDFSGTHVMDSQGIEVLVRHYTTLSQRGGELKLLNPSPRVHEVLKIAGLLEYCPAYEDEAQALQSFPK